MYLSLNQTPLMTLKCIFFVVLTLLIRFSLVGQETKPTYLPRLNLPLKPISKLPSLAPRLDWPPKLETHFKDRKADSVVINRQIAEALAPVKVNQRLLSLRASIVPASLIIAGTITLVPEPKCLLSKYRIQEEELKLFPGIRTSVDNYLQFMPLAAVFGLKSLGVKSRSDFVNQTLLTAKAELLMGVIVRGMKQWIRMERPSGGGMNTMPSGHTAQAFVAAAILDKEYHDTSPWISVGGYAVATTTALGRMVNNKHWISDVLIGAGIGIFSTQIVYNTHRYRFGKTANMVMVPVIYPNGGGVSFAMKL